MKKATVKLFDDNVLLEHRQKKTVSIVLPDSAPGSSGELYEFVVRRVGDAVKNVKCGDVVIPMNLGQHQAVRCDIGNGAVPYLVVRESQICGVQL